MWRATRGVLCVCAARMHSFGMPDTHGTSACARTLLCVTVRRSGSRWQGRKSDAILSCPGCLTTVCIDCQQHAVFENQFRAMFTMNCRCASLWI